MGRDRTRLRQTIGAVAACALLVAGGATWLVVTDRWRPHHQRLTQDLAEQIVANLTSGDPARVQQAIAWPAGEAIDPNIVAGLATAQISLDSTTFRAAEGAATVHGTLRIASEPSMPYTFYFVDLDGHWLFFDGLPDEPPFGQPPARAPRRNAVGPAHVAPAALSAAGPPEWSCLGSSFDLSKGGTKVGLPDQALTWDLPTGTSTSAQSAKARPVILVHGWTDDSGNMDTLMRAINRDLGDRVEVHRFDFTPVNDVWGGNVAVSGCLAAYIDGVSTSWKAQGGDGRVIVVGYSMGGLAIRYASAYSVGGRDVAKQLAGVVTVDTPHLGSPFGGTGGAWFKASWDRLWRDNGTLFVHWDRDAFRCLATRKPDSDMPQGCGDAPPFLPANVPVQQVAGEISIKHKVLFWGGTTTDNLHGDGVVPTESEQGYDTSGPKNERPARAAKTTLVTCTVTSDQLLAKAVEYGDWVWQSYVRSFLGPAANLVIGDMSIASAPLVAVAAALAADCGHLKIITESGGVNAVVSSIRSTIGS